MGHLGARPSLWTWTMENYEVKLGEHSVPIGSVRLHIQSARVANLDAIRSAVRSGAQAGMILVLEPTSNSDGWIQREDQPDGVNRVSVCPSQTTVRNQIA
jgi:hypothetical protein